MHPDGRLERRRAPRSCLIAGAHFVVRGQTQACVLVNLSRTGACLHFLTSDPAPDTMLLQLPGGLTRVARLRWQEGDRAGFAFLEPLSDTRDVAADRSVA